MSILYSPYSYAEQDTGKLASLKQLAYFIVHGKTDERYVRTGKLERNQVNAFFKKLSRKKFLFLPSYSNSKIMTLGTYIHELLFEQNCVVVPGLGGFISRKVPAQINPISNKINPPGKKIAFNQALHLNDGLLAKYVSEKEDISYDEALNKIHHLLVELRQTLFETRTVHLEKVGTFYMDYDEVTTFHPEADLNVSRENFGLVTLSAIPVQRSQEDRLKLKIKTRVDQRSKDLSKSRARIMPKMAAAAAACVVLGMGIWTYVNLPEARSFAASVDFTSWFKTAEKTEISPVTKPVFPVDAAQMKSIHQASSVVKGDSTWSVLIGGFSGISEARKCIDDLQAQKIQAGFSIQDAGKTWVYVAKSGDRALALSCVASLQPAYPDARIIGIRNR